MFIGTEFAGWNIGQIARWRWDEEHATLYVWLAGQADAESLCGEEAVAALDALRACRVTVQPNAGADLDESEIE